MNETTSIRTRGRILDLVREHGPITRPDLARRTGLTRASVSLHINALIQQRLVEESGYEQSKGGRMPATIELARDGNCSLGLVLHDREVFCNLADFHDRSLSSKRVWLDPKTAREQILQVLESLFEQQLGLIRQRNLSLRQVILGAGADFDAHGTVVRSLHFPNLQGVNLKHHFQRFADRNRVVASAGQIMFHGLLDGELPAERVATVFWTTGVCWMHGRDGGLCHDVDAMPGLKLLGHQPLAENSGIRCLSCGQVGCLEAEMSGCGIIARLAATGLRLYRDLDVVRLADIAGRGDQRVIGALSEAIRTVGRFMAPAVLLTMPKYLRVVTCLGLPREILLDNFRSGLAAGLPPAQLEALDLAVVEDLDGLLLKGMPRMARHLFFQNPLQAD